MSNTGRTQRRATTRTSAAKKIAAQRAAQRARRRRLLLAGGSGLLVIVIAVTFVAIKVLSKPAKAKPAVALAAVAREVTTLPASVFSTALAGKSTTPLIATQGHPALLSSGGKPEVLYMGGEYCPYCAAERWVLTAALSRFGTFSGLSFIHSAPDDGDIATLTFHGAHYTSKYLSFAGDEWYTEDETKVLQAPVSAQLALFRKYDGPPYVPADQADGFPFVDVGNRYLSDGAQLEPAELSGLTWQQIASDMRNPDSSVGRDLDTAVNVLTASLCQLTGGQPSSVCTSAGVKAAAGDL